MTTNVILPAARIEELLRALEDAPEHDPEQERSLTAKEMFDAYFEQVSLKPAEFAAILGELIAVRKLAGSGSGAIVNFRGNVNNEGVAGIYRRMKFKFNVEIGAPGKELTEKELSEIAQRTVQFILQKVGGEFEQFEAEMKEHRAKKEKVEAEQKTDPGTVN